MPVFLLLLINAIFVLPAFGVVDLSFKADAGTYPMLAGELAGEIGYDVLLWRDNSPGAEDFRYGYLRPFTALSWIGSYSALAAGIEVYPISFVALRAGTNWQYDATDYPGYDCRSYNCSGHMRERFGEAEFSFSKGKWDEALRLGVGSWYQSRSRGRQTIEPSMGVLISPDGELSQTAGGAVMWHFKNPWAVFSNLVYSRTIESHGYSKMGTAGLYYTNSGWSVSAGAGLFRSQLKPLGGVLFVEFGWEIWPGLDYKPGAR